MYFLLNTSCTSLSAERTDETDINLVSPLLADRGWYLPKRLGALPSKEFLKNKEKNKRESETFVVL